MAVKTVPGYLKYRVVNRVTGQEVIADLPHLHQSKWTIRAMTPGGTAQATFSPFSIPLFPPGSPEFDKNFQLYWQLLPGSGEGYRVEAYDGNVDGAAPRFAGIITEVEISTESQGTFELRGYSDPWIAAMQRFFPAELTSADTTTHNSMDRFQRYLSENVLVWSDAFSPYDATQYNVLTGTTQPVVGPWTWINTGTESAAGGTDANGLNPQVLVVSVTDGQTFDTGVTPNVYALQASWLSMCAKTSIIPQDADDSVYAEIFVRWQSTPQAQANGDATTIWMMFQSSSTPVNGNTGSPSNDVAIGYHNLTPSTGQLDVATNGGTAVTINGTQDEDGFWTAQIGLFMTSTQLTSIVNGSVVATTTPNPVLGGTNPIYLGLMFQSPADGASQTQIATPLGTATFYVTNLILAARNSYRTMGASAPFVAGALGAGTHSQAKGVTQSPTFLDAWTAIADMEGFYWRYTPKRMMPGTHPPMGTVDCSVAPGVDRSRGSTAGRNVIFRAGPEHGEGNLEWVRVQGNSETFSSDLVFNGRPSSGSGGQFYVRNIAAIKKYGWLTDTALSASTTEFYSFYRLAGAHGNAKAAPGESWVAKVLRDPATADVWRELDYVTVHEPKVGLYFAKLLVIAYTYTEGSGEMDVTFGHYGTPDIASTAKRTISPLVHTAFGSRPV